MTKKKKNQVLFKSGNLTLSFQVAKKSLIMSNPHFSLKDFIAHW